MGLKQSIKDKLFDVRLRDKLLADGRITKEEVDEYLASLDDSQENANVYNPYEKKRVEHQIQD